MKTLAERLAEARKDARMSQSQLAFRAGCGQSTIASIERGRNQGSTVLPRLADVLGVSALWLAEGRGPKKPEEIGSGHKASEPKTLYGQPPPRPIKRLTTTSDTQGWPFKRIEVGRLLALPAEEQAFVEGLLAAAIKDAETRLKKVVSSNGL